MSEEEKKTEEVKQEVEEQGIVVSSVEDDMKALGIETEVKPESKEEDIQPKEEAQTEVKEPKKSRAQRRIERQAKEVIELKEENERLRKQTVTPKVEAKKPDAEDFEDYEKYEKALEEFNKPPVEEKVPEQPKADARIADMTEDGEADYEDFNKLVTAPDLALTETVLLEVLETESPSDIVYYLASNKDKAREIANMSKRQMSRAIYKIELELEKKPNKKVQTTKAPKPISPVDGNSPDPKSLADNDLSFEEHERLLNQRTQALPGGFI